MGCYDGLLWAVGCCEGWICGVGCCDGCICGVGCFMVGYGVWDVVMVDMWCGVL